MSMAPMPLDAQRAVHVADAGEIGAIQSGWRLALREFVSNRLAVIGFGMLIFFVLFCFIGPYLYHTNQLDTNDLLANLPPNGSHLLGTDNQGFDELGRIMKGGQAALEIGFFAAFVAIVVGTLMKVLFEAPWDLAPRPSAMLGMSVAPVAHACGIAAGVLAWGASRLLLRRSR